MFFLLFFEMFNFLNRSISLISISFKFRGKPQQLQACVMLTCLLFSVDAILTADSKSCNIDTNLVASFFKSIYCNESLIFGPINLIPCSCYDPCFRKGRNIIFLAVPKHSKMACSQVDVKC